MKARLQSAAVALLFFAALVCAQQPGSHYADTIYHNGKIVTLWKERPVAEAVAIRDGRFLAVGSSADVLKLAGPKSQRVDLKGRNVVPGIVESHVHPISAALSEKEGPVPVMNSIVEVQEYVRQQAKKLAEGQLIFVPKVYSTRMEERRYPTRDDLDAASRNHLVIADNGYAAVLNSRALQVAGIDRNTSQPQNGKIIKGANGEPTGLILGARQLLGDLLSARQYTDEDRLWALTEMQKRYNRAGITSIIDRGQGPEGFRAYQRLKDEGKLTIRSYVTYLISPQGTPEEVERLIEQIPFVTGWGDEWLRAGSLKAVLDGGILIGTAYLREPYGQHTQIYGYEDPDYRGVLAAPRENIVAMAKAANRLGWQMTAHTAGGGATDVLLDAYEEANKDKPIRERRFTVTHGNFPNSAAIEQAKRLGVVFDCQPAWHHFDGPAIKDVFGPARMDHFIPLRSLIDAGVVVAGGSDHMIRFDARQSLNPYHPFYGMWMAVTRKTADGSVLQPEQRITREEALRLWTLNGAYLSFEERLKGSIEPGKLADFTVIDRNYLICPEDEIRDIEAVMTVVGGRVVFDAAKEAGAA